MHSVNPARTHHKLGQLNPRGRAMNLSAPVHCAETSAWPRQWEKETKIKIPYEWSAHCTDLRVQCLAQHSSSSLLLAPFVLWRFVRNPCNADMSGKLIACMYACICTLPFRGCGLVIWPGWPPTKIPVWVISDEAHGWEGVWGKMGKRGERAGGGDAEKCRVVIYRILPIALHSVART